MKKAFDKIISVFGAACLISGTAVYAADDISIKQYFTVDDRITMYVSGISSDDIEASVAGVSCEADNLGDLYNDSEKYCTYFLIDSSKSMQSFSDEIDDFMRECIDSKPDNEFYSIGLFSSQNSPEYIISDEAKQYDLEKALDDLEYEFNSTYIYDNLINVIKQLDSAEDTCFKRIVLITDGNENSARGITINDVMDELEKNPVPVYTVTLQTSSKSNLENLKNISRLARSTDSSDIRITNGDDVRGSADVLNDDANDIFCIEIELAPSMLDGAVKAVQISDGSSHASCDIRMLMQSAPETSTEPVTEAVTSETTIMTEAALQDDEGVSGKTVIIVAAAAVVVIACAIVIITVLTKKEKKKPQSPTADIFGADNGMTEILPGEGGQTEILIDDGKRYKSITLRDIADSARTFKVQLSPSGVVIGRSLDMADIVIDYDKAVSRKHCRIYLNGGKVYIEDLGSGNKTYVNNVEESSPCMLNNADEIKVGRTRLKVTLE